jgi:hypothetical protein
MTSHTFVLAGVTELGGNKYRVLPGPECLFDVGPEGIGPKIRGNLARACLQLHKVQKVFYLYGRNTWIEKASSMGKLLSNAKKKNPKVLYGYPRKFV